jgi:hypothetical protein
VTTALLVRRYLGDYVRSPLNLVLLVLVPVAWVTICSSALAKFAHLIGGVQGGSGIVMNAAGWAAAFLAGISVYFQVSESRATDRRLVLAGLGASRLVLARLATGFVLALVATVAALLALAARTGILDPVRTVGATLMFAAIYLAIGSVLGVLVRDQLNGAVAILFVWFLDVFLSPTITGSNALFTQLLPTHFVSLLVVGASNHAGSLGNLGASALWTSAALVAAALVFVTATRGARNRPRSCGGSAARVAAGIRFGFREYRRNVVFWAMLVIVPFAFITLMIAITPAIPLRVQLVSTGGSAISVISMVHVHGAIMAPITVAFLSGIAGLFVVIGSSDADRRLVLAGFRAGEVLAARFALIAVAAVLAVAVSMVVTDLEFQPQQWLPFVGANLLIALIYAMVGVILGPLVGRIGGLYLIFLLPFMDLGIVQDPMFYGTPLAWAKFLPGYGPVRLLMNGSFTSFTCGVDGSWGLPYALAWLVGLTGIATIVFHRIAAPKRI